MKPPFSYGFPMVFPWFSSHSPSPRGPLRGPGSGLLDAHASDLTRDFLQTARDVAHDAQDLLRSSNGGNRHEIFISGYIFGVWEILYGKYYGYLGTIIYIYMIIYIYIYISHGEIAIKYSG